MRTYGRKYVKRYIERKQRLFAESRDAILWDILEDDRVCRVKIQGSDELVVCHFPLNWSRKPNWLKVGNAVRVQHRSGMRGWLEVANNGRAIPSAVPGGTARPPTPIAEDGVLSGLVVRPGGGMSVQISAGIYRIGGTLYSVSALTGQAIIMDDPAPMTMGEPYYTMGESVGTLELDSAPDENYYYRYDSIVIGVDGVFEVLKGVESARLSEPVMPETPANHVRVGWVLLYNGVTEVTVDQINKVWTFPEPSDLSLRYDSQYSLAHQGSYPDGVRSFTFYTDYHSKLQGEAPWGYEIIVVTILDQYNQPDGVVRPKTLTFTLVKGDPSFVGHEDDTQWTETTQFSRVQFSWHWPSHIIYCVINEFPVAFWYNDSAYGPPVFTVQGEGFGFAVSGFTLNSVGSTAPCLE